ncbi:MFS transporter [Streptomyces sp. NPDC048514]|uniref:MFS transporter n=1 Tax=Streptomyces sp. NPDC048514 TaxID=3365564 RepID=UPI00371CB9C9
MSPKATVLPDTDHRHVEHAQARTLRVLVGSQIFSGAGLAAGVTVGALLAQDMLGSTDLAGLPSALFTAGSAVAAIVVGRVSQARGRRPGLSAGYVVGAVGGAGVVLAAVVNSPALLFLALFLYGSGTATNLQARYAGADLAAAGHRARAVSTVLVSTAVGGVVGPALATPAGSMAAAIGIPRLSGLFLLAAAAYAAAALVLALWLRPDPLLLAQALHAAAAEAGPESSRQDDPTRRDGHPRREGVARKDEAARAPEAAGPRGGVVLGTVVQVLSQLIMVAVMTMTPVHMHDHGLGTGSFGLVIAVHIGSMYLPSPLTGHLVDRFGRLTMAAASGLTFLAAGLTAAFAPGDSVALMSVALGLLGIGWNFGLVSGTAIVTDAVPLATRARTQGLVDVAIAIAGATGGLASGIVVATLSYPALALGSGVLALSVLPAVAATAHSRVQVRG